MSAQAGSDLTGTEGTPHILPVTVYYEDTDMGGIVYHANYLKYIERGRSAWVRALGIDQNALREAGLIFAVHHIEATFRRAARLDDALRVETVLRGATGARFVLAQRVRRGEAVLFDAVVTVVAMTPDGRAARLPAELRRCLGPGTQD